MEATDSSARLRERASPMAEYKPEGDPAKQKMYDELKEELKAKYLRLAQKNPNALLEHQLAFSIHREIPAPILKNMTKLAEKYNKETLTWLNAFTRRHGDFGEKYTQFRSLRSG